jgi:hypothetical protein
MEAVLEGEVSGLDGKYGPSGLTPDQEFEVMVRLETALVERLVILTHDADGRPVYVIGKLYPISTPNGDIPFTYPNTAFTPMFWPEIDSPWMSVSSCAHGVPIVDAYPLRIEGEYEAVR